MMKQNLHEASFGSFSILPPNPKRIGEGGLRKRGYYKDEKNLPLITVITVVFNGAETLERSILSVINQIYDNVEFIVIDGGSSDGTLDIIKKYNDKIDYWVSEQDKGIYDAMNKGIRCSTGDWICFLGADDYLWKNNVIERMVPTFISVPHDTKLVYGSVALINENGETILVVGEPWAAAKKKIADTMSLPHQGVMHHRTWFEQYGEFDISYRITGDYEMLLRGWPRENALFIPDFIISAMGRGGVSSDPRNSITILREARRAQKTHGIDLPSWRWIAALWRVHVRLALQATLGERSTRRLLDIGRRILGKSPYWTKL